MSVHWNKARSNSKSIWRAGVVLALVAFASPIWAAPQKLEKTSIGNVDYISLSDWSTRHRYEIHKSRAGEGVELVHEKSRLIFEKDSNFGSVNGVNVVLSWPVAVRNGSAYIASLDAHTILDPIIFPVSLERSKITTICLDAGHGGKDPGTQDGPNQEKRQTLLLAQEVARELKGLGFKVVQTRTRDKFVDKPDRAETANRKGADLFVSFHFNSSADRSVSGIETYCLTPPGAISSNSQEEGSTGVSAAGNANDRQNMLFAYHIQHALVHELRVPDRGIHLARFAVLKPLLMPGVLVEGGFMSNPSESRRLSDAQYRKKVARAVSDGIEGFCRAVEARGFAANHEAKK